MKKSALAFAVILGVTSTSASAFDYFFQTGRSAGYGSAGTTYAHWSAAANYNPALMGAASGAKSTEDFFVVLPNVRGNLVTSKSVDDINDIFKDFEELNDEFDQMDNIDLLEGDINELNRNIELSNDMLDQVQELDGLGAHGGFGGGLALGVSFKSFAVGFHINTQFSGGGSANVSEADIALFRRFTDLGQTLLDDVRPLYDQAVLIENDLLEKEQALLQNQDAYNTLINSGNTDPATIAQAQDLINSSRDLVDAAQIQYDQALDLADQAKVAQTTVENEFGDIFDVESQSVTFQTDDLASNGRFAGIGWFEVGSTIGTKWDLKSGKTVSAGVTLKSVHLEFFDYVASVASLDTGNIDGDDYRNQVDFATADLGIIVGLDNKDKWRIGATVKNISGETIKSNPLRLPEGVEALTFEVEPQVRVGTSYNGGWFRLAADVDVTHASGPLMADGTEFFQGSQYVNLGAVINAWDFIELRGGYRHNLASADVASDAEASSGLITMGAGLFLGPIQADIALQASPDADEIGFGFQTMITF